MALHVEGHRPRIRWHDVLFPLGVQNRILRNGCIEIKRRFTGFISIPAHKAPALFFGILGPHGLFTVFHLLGIDITSVTLHFEGHRPFRDLLVLCDINRVSRYNIGNFRTPPRKAPTRLCLHLRRRPGFIDSLRPLFNILICDLVCFIRPVRQFAVVAALVGDGIPRRSPLDPGNGEFIFLIAKAKNRSFICGIEGVFVKVLPVCIDRHRIRGGIGVNINPSVWRFRDLRLRVFQGPDILIAVVHIDRWNDIRRHRIDDCGAGGRLDLFYDGLCDIRKCGVQFTCVICVKGIISVGGNVVFQKIAHRWAAGIASVICRAEADGIKAFNSSLQSRCRSSSSLINHSTAVSAVSSFRSWSPKQTVLYAVISRHTIRKSDHITQIFFDSRNDLTIKQTICLFQTLLKICSAISI